MKVNITTLLLLAFLTACGATNTLKPSLAEKQKATVSGKEKPVVDMEKVAYAERVGALLNKAMLSPDAEAPYTSRESTLIDMTKDMRCDGNYKAVSVFDPVGNTENIYLILAAPQSEGFQLGRHIRFRFTQGTNDIIDTNLSTKTCLFIPITGDGMPYASHILSNEPSEFHVFLSLHHNKPIYIGTTAGVWKVEAGKITLLEK